MKRRLLLLALGLVLTTNAFAASRGNHQAPDRVGRWDIGLGAAAAMNDVNDDTGYYSVAVSYGVTPYIGLGVEAGWQESDTDAPNNESVGVVPILFDIIFRCPDVHKSLVPYAVLGLGFAGVYVTNEPASAALQGDDVDDTSFAWKLGAGADWFINPNWLMNFEVAYIDAGGDLPGSSVADGVDFWTIGAGLKYIF